MRWQSRYSAGNELDILNEVRHLEFISGPPALRAIPLSVTHPYVLNLVVTTRLLGYNVSKLRHCQP